MLNIISVCHYRWASVNARIHYRAIFIARHINSNTAVISNIFLLCGVNTCDV